MDIRTIEREVVDQYHRSLKVWRWPQSAIVWGVLRHLGQVPREFQSLDVPDKSLVDSWRVFDAFKRGAAQAIRWADESKVGEYDWLSENEQILDETSELLNWAVDYARLSACFVAWTRKAMNAHLDVSMRRIRFALHDGVAASLIAADLNEAERNSRAFVAPVYSVRRLLSLDVDESWLAAGQWPNERTKLKHHPVFDEVVEWAGQVLLPELEDTVSLGRFDLSDLRQFWATLWLVSTSYAITEDDLDRRTEHKNDLPAAVLCMTKDQWIHRLAAALEFGVTVHGVQRKESVETGI